MLEELQVEFHVDLGDEEIILPSAQGSLWDGWMDWVGRNQEGGGHSGGGDGMCKSWRPASVLYS